MQSGIVASLLGRLKDRPANVTTNIALMWGVAWLIVGAILGWRFDIVPTSMVGYTWGAASLLWHTMLQLVMWISSTVIFFLCGVLLNRKVAVTELFGRMLYAHIPVTLLILPGELFSKASYATFMTNPIAAFEQSVGYALPMSIFVVVVFAWYLYWGYGAFCRSTSRRGGVVFAIYIVAFVLSVVLSHYTIEAVYMGMI